MRTNAGTGWRCAAAILVFLAGAAPAAAEGEGRLEVRVVGAAGAGVGDATVYLMALNRNTTLPEVPGPPGPRHTTPAPVHVFRTSPEGNLATTLPAARYRVAATKPGYDVSFTEVDTLVRRLVIVRLREASRVLLGDLPDKEEKSGLGWILREPAGDVLHDQDDAVPTVSAGAGAESPTAGRLLAFLGPVDGQFSQHCSAGGLGAAGESGRGGSGHATRLSLSGALAGQGRWRFAGLSGRQAVDGGEDDQARIDRRTDRMQFGIDWRLGEDDTLAADLRFGAGRFVVQPDDSAVATEEEQRVLGLGSRWERKLGEAARLYVAGSIQEAGVHLPEGTGPVLADEAVAGGLPDRLTHRSLLAAAGVALAAGEHRLDFGLRAKSYRHDSRDRGILIDGLGELPTLTESGDRGEVMSLYGADDWRVASGSVLNYGLGYHSSLSNGVAFFVPRLGLTYEIPQAPSTRLRSVVLYRVDDPWMAPSTAGEGGGPGGTAPGRLGYLVGVERRALEGLQIAAAFSYHPFEESGDRAGDVEVPGAWGDTLLYLTDGTAGRHDLEVTLARGFGGVRGSLMGNLGRVEGRIAPVLAESPLLVMSLGEVRYWLTRLAAEIDPTDTEVRIDFRQVSAETGEAAAGPAAVDYRRLDLSVSQDVPLRGLQSARLRILMAYQGLIHDETHAGGGASAAAIGPAARLTGGVDIQF